MRRDLINFFSRFKESYYNKLIFSSITVLAGPVHIFYPAAAFTMNFFCVGGECFRFMPDDNTDYLRQRASAYRSSYHYCITTANAEHVPVLCFIYHDDLLAGIGD